MNEIQMAFPGSLAAQCRMTSDELLQQMVLNLFAKYSDWFICRFFSLSLISLLFSCLSSITGSEQAAFMMTLCNVFSSGRIIFIWY